MRESRARIALLSMLVLNACDDSGAPPGGRTGVDAGAALETPEGFVRRFSAALCEAVADCQWPVGLVRPPRVPIAGRYADTDVDNADWRIGHPTPCGLETPPPVGPTGRRRGAPSAPTDY